MGKETLRAELNLLERKVRLLIGEFSRLQSETLQLKAENEQLKKQLEDKDVDLTNFQNQAEISKIVESMLVGKEGSTDLGEKIDDYIKEIDKCIAHLGEA